MMCTKRCDNNAEEQWIMQTLKSVIGDDVLPESFEVDKSLTLFKI